MRLILVVLLASTILAAQTDDPCATTVATTYHVQRAESVRVGFCHVPALDDGTPIPLGTMRFYVTDTATGAILQNLGLLVPVQAAANGNYYYEGPPHAFAADISLTIVVEYQAAYAASSPIVVDIRGGPRSPTHIRLN